MLTLLVGNSQDVVTQKLLAYLSSLAGLARGQGGNPVGSGWWGRPHLDS